MLIFLEVIAIIGGMRRFNMEVPVPLSHSNEGYPNQMNYWENHMDYLKDPGVWALGLWSME